MSLSLINSRTFPRNNYCDQFIFYPFPMLTYPSVYPRKLLGGGVCFRDIYTNDTVLYLFFLAIWFFSLKIIILEVFQPMSICHILSKYCVAFHFMDVPRYYHFLTKRL